MNPTWSDQDVTVSGSTFHLTRSGDGSRPAIVLAHGFSDAGMCWIPAVGELADECELVLPDARGHGRSARVQPGAVIDHAGDLAGVIRALGLQRPIIGGHSMGASSSSQAAARFPDLARALIVEDPVWRAPQPESVPARPNPFADFLLSLAGRSLDELAASCHAMNPAWPEAELRPWAASKQQFDFNVLEERRVTPPPWQETVRAIRCPTLLVTADPERGAIVTPAIASEACALNPLLRAVYIPGAGHNIRRENHPQFIAAVREFLKEIEGYGT